MFNTTFLGYNSLTWRRRVLGFKNTTVRREVERKSELVFYEMSHVVRKARYRRSSHFTLNQHKQGKSKSSTNY